MFCSQIMQCHIKARALKGCSSGPPIKKRPQIIFSCKILKGAQVYIEGQLNTNKYTDSNGQEKYSTQIVLQGYSSSLTMLDGKNSSSGDSKKLEGTQLPSDDMTDISQDPDDKVPF